MVAQIHSEEDTDMEYIVILVLEIILAYFVWKLLDVF